MKTKYLIFVLLIAMLFSCKDKAIDETFVQLEDMPAASYMKANPDQFSLWVELLEYTNLFNSLNLNANYTCFVPSNAAIQQYLQAKGKSSVKDFDLEFAKALVKYHIIQTSNKRYTQSYFETGIINDSTSSGDYLTIEIREGGINAIYINGEARIEKLDIAVTNAVIHTIDKVLSPITETIWDKIVANNNYSVLEELLQATKYDTLLSNKNYKSTLFAVPNSVFSSSNVAGTESLALQLGAGNDYTSPSNLVNKFVAYHILPQQMSFSQLSTFTTNTLTKNMNTLAVNEIISLTDLEGTLFINYDAGSMTGVKLVSINSNCKNGIIHEVDKLMTLFSPKPATYIWELTDYSELATKYTSVYRKTTLTSASTNNISQGSVSCYNWQTVLPENLNSSVKYYVSANSGSRFEALNADYLRLKLYLYGWIELKTPAVVKGTYNLILAHHSPKSTSYKFTLVLDGNIMGIITLPSNPSKDLYIKTTALASNVIFDSTKEHTVRIIANDNNELELDYILFQPVN